MNVQTWRPALVAVLAFAVVGVLAFVFQDALAETIVNPLLYVGWYGGLLFNSLDQGCIWVAAVVVALILGLVWSQRPRVPRERAHAPATRLVVDGRIRHWLVRVQAKHDSVFAREAQQAELRTLVTEVWAHYQHVSEEQARKMLRSGAIPLPEDVRVTLGLAAGPRPEAPGLLARAGAWVAQWLPHRAQDTNRPNLEIEPVLKYLEGLLEGIDDSRSL